jgi:NtrC-family two-component system sensor histidine kinase KinB
VLTSLLIALAFVAGAIASMSWSRARTRDREQSLATAAARDYHARVAELDHERSKIDAIIESVEDGLIVLDGARAIVHINEVAAAILVLDAKPGVVLEALAERNPHVARLLAALRNPDSGAGAPAEFKVFLRGRDHTYISRELKWTGPSSQPLGTILLLQDVTFIRDQERQRTNLIATLSHELKTPLTSLALGAELMAESARGDASERQRELLETIRNDIDRLTAIANNLLDASRTSVARIGVERRPILLDRVIGEVCRPLARQAEEKNITLEVLASEQPIPIWGDPIKLPWVITNLVGNSLRYTAAGGRIRIELAREGKIARIVVSDSGIGIAPELMPRIFEPYAQFPDAGAAMGSAGLGLYIAKEIVEAHNGRIFAQSGRGRGTIFTIEIPIREEALGSDTGR